MTLQHTSAKVFVEPEWSRYYAGKEWPRDQWCVRFMKSPAYLLLHHMDKRAVWTTFEYFPLNPFVPKDRETVAEVDQDYIAAQLTPPPSFVIACGVRARVACRHVWSGPLLTLPCPVKEPASEALYSDAGLLVKVGFTQLVELHDRDGRVMQVRW